MARKVNPVRRKGFKGMRGGAEAPRPLPEAIFEGPWKVELEMSSTGSCNKTDKVFRAPFDTHVEGRTGEYEGVFANREAVRIHEYLHLQLSSMSPTDHPRVQEILDRVKSTPAGAKGKQILETFASSVLDGVGSLEDLRVNEIAVKEGAPNIASSIRDNFVTKQQITDKVNRITNEITKLKLKKSDPIPNKLTYVLGCLLTCVSHTGAEETTRPLRSYIEKTIDQDYFDLLDTVIREVKSERTFDSVVDGAIKLAFEFYNREMSLMLQEESKKEEKEKGELMPVEDGKKRLPPQGDNQHKWGKMTIVEPPRPIKVKPPKMYVRRDTGMAIRSPERILTDGLSFREKIQTEEPLGTILLDMSGSMGLRQSQILALIKADIEVKVAGYEGSDNKGELTILADKMSCVDTIERRFGGNVIDGPALEWLATQKGPLTWISDGGITGEGDASMGLVTRTKVEKFCEDNHIERVRTIGEFLKSKGIKYEATEDDE